MDGYQRKAALFLYKWTWQKTGLWALAKEKVDDSQETCHNGGTRER